MQVARMVDAAGLKVTPHITIGGLGFLYMMHMVSVCPATYNYHEFKMFDTFDANLTPFEIENHGEPFASNDGIIGIPSAPGMGVTIDPAYVATHKVFTG
jgi:L-alanine-DL-glutamate epimerase-like enolase superfamily enzyme